ncbi:TPA: hypothetical protein ACH3X2_009916 [Trebouxia sp. C0005]
MALFRSLKQNCPSSVSGGAVSLIRRQYKAEFERRMHWLTLAVLRQVDCQEVTNSAKLTAQHQAIQSEQAELIVDLQHRLQHLANVNARYDDQRGHQLGSLQK